MIVNQQDAPSCPNCGQITVRNGACYKCSTAAKASAARKEKLTAHRRPAKLFAGLFLFRLVLNLQSSNFVLWTMNRRSRTRFTAWKLVAFYQTIGLFEKN